MKLQNKALISLDGKPLREGPMPGLDGKVVPTGDEPIVTVATVLISVAMRQKAPGATPYTGAEAQARFNAARALSAVELGAPFDLPNELVVQLTKDVVECYGPLVVGQMVGYLEGE